MGIWQGCDSGVDLWKSCGIVAESVEGVGKEEGFPEAGPSLKLLHARSLAPLVKTRGFWMTPVKRGSQSSPLPGVYPKVTAVMSGDTLHALPVPLPSVRLIFG
jgi:hypothetical protein